MSRRGQDRFQKIKERSDAGFGGFVSLGGASLDLPFSVEWNKIAARYTNPPGASGQDVILILCG